MKNERGSVTFIAYVAMLFFALYGIIIYSNSTNAYLTQSKAIENVKKAYDADYSTSELITIYNSIGAEPIDLSN